VSEFIPSHRISLTDIEQTGHHDIYHLPGYLQLESAPAGDEPVYWTTIHNGARIFIPLIKRKITGKPLFDLVSPYGYPGILTGKELAEEEANEIIKQFNDHAREESYVSSFLRLSPIHNSWKNLSAENILQVIHGKTVCIALSSDIDTIRSYYSLNHKRNLKRIVSDGFMATINDWERLEEFYRIYIQTMSRHFAATRYFLPVDYFLSLKAIEGAHVFFVSVYDKDKNYTSGGLFSLVNKSIQFLYGATADKYVRYSPSKLMIDKATEWGRQQGAEMMNLGGGLGASVEDGLFRFKKGFSSRFRDFSTVRIIHNKKIYGELLKEKGIVATEPNDPSGFFPAYREER